ncbi:MAG: cyclic nucleotide-binding domain-containing protein [Acidobacteria bacterium]|nr:cyclic nucleotide-binding domain-containing protein [Acidobacteriota bacterium]
MSKATMSTRNNKLAAAERIEGASPSLLRLYSRLGVLPNANLERVARGSECQLIPTGKTIFRQEDDADAVYLLLDGEIRLEHRNENGEAVMHRVFGPYESFGDVALLGEGSRYYTASTSSVSVVIRTPLSLLREVLATDPNLATAWIHAVSTDLQRREQRLADSVAQHIAHPAFFDAA